MKSVEFCYWLQGFYEIAKPKQGLTQEQSEMIQKHLQLVFVHEIDPSYPKDQQQLLNEIHNGPKPTNPIIGGTLPTGEKLRC
jgi:hypothetical protein